MTGLLDSHTRLLVCVAHPDDDVLCAGGTIAKAVDAGSLVRIVFFGEGSTARFETADMQGEAARAAIRDRQECALRAGKILGLEADAIGFGELGCCRFDSLPHIELVKVAEREIDAFKPTVLITHATGDTNIDHRTLSQAILTAARPIRYPFIRLLLRGEVLSSTETNPSEPFTPNLFIDISKTFDRKWNALAAYESEIGEAPNPRSRSVLEALAKVRGGQAGMPLAEGFEIVRQFDG